jgi:predicted regulator of Ras-like GTPase activity (Roadblock/LC7/MglB family)
MDATQALADLTEISSQIHSAVILDGDGNVVASTFADEERARRVADKARELLAAAEEVPGGAGRSLAQLEAATLEGSVFVVRDDDRAIAATTSPEPTVGLVFYDLKSCLRGAAGEEKPRPRPKRKPAETKDDDAQA